MNLREDRHNSDDMAEAVHGAANKAGVAVLKVRSMVGSICLKLSHSDNQKHLTCIFLFGLSDDSINIWICPKSKHKYIPNIPKLA